MSPDAITAERVYADLKRELLGGRFAPARPLNVHSLADEVGTSITPVRDALQRLVGERLVEIQPGGGFSLPPLVEEGLRDLYQWHAQMVRAAVRSGAPGNERRDLLPTIDALSPDDSAGIATVTAELFTRIGERTENVEHRQAIRSAGERLHAIRVHETAIKDRPAELRSLWDAAVSGREDRLREAISAYHQRRIRRLSQTIGALLASSR